MTSRIPTLIALAVLVAGGPIQAVGLAQEPTTGRADSLFQAQQWGAAEAAYQALSRQDTTNGQVWMRLGYARYMQEKFESAARAWERSGALGFSPGTAYYNAASAYARLGRTDTAFAALGRAAAAGFPQVDQLDSDTDLASLRTDERFSAIRQLVDKNAHPCRYDERYRQFDFWVGTWSVFNPRGQQVGSSRIELILDDCVLLENWTDARGGTGKSFNYFDPHAGTWKQLWVNPLGGHADYEGSLTDGAMRFEGTAVASDGTTHHMRMTFTPLDDGRVRQFIEQSTDGGTTWTPGFNGVYTRAEKQGQH